MHSCLWYKAISLPETGWTVWRREALCQVAAGWVITFASQLWSVGRVRWPWFPYCWHFLPPPPLLRSMSPAGIRQSEKTILPSILHPYTHPSIPSINQSISFKCTSPSWDDHHRWVTRKATKLLNYNLLLIPFNYETGDKQSCHRIGLQYWNHEGTLVMR